MQVVPTTVSFSDAWDGDDTLVYDPESTVAFILSECGAPVGRVMPVWGFFWQGGTCSPHVCLHIWMSVLLLHLAKFGSRWHPHMCGSCRVLVAWAASEHWGSARGCC